MLDDVAAQRQLAYTDHLRQRLQALGTEVVNPVQRQPSASPTASAASPCAGSAA